MRIVQFDNPASIIVYPEEGVTAFGATVKKGTKIIGEYNGAQIHPLLENYDNTEGAWPFVPDPIFITEYRMDEFRDDVITNGEWEVLGDSVNADIVSFLKQIDHRNGLLNVVDAMFVDMVDAGVTTTIFSVPRGDELKAGILI